MILLRKAIYSMLAVFFLMILSGAPLSAMGTDPEADSSDTEANTISSDTIPAASESDTEFVEGITDTGSTDIADTDLSGEIAETGPRSVVDTGISDVATDTGPDDFVDTGKNLDGAETGPGDLRDTGISGDVVEKESVKRDTKVLMGVSDTSGELALPVKKGQIKYDRTEQQKAFTPGEKVVLRVSYLGFTAGYIRVNVKQDTIENRPIYLLKMKAKTAGAGEWFYSASDRFVSYMDMRGLYSWGFDYFKNHEGERETQIVRYYQNKGFFAENGNRGGTIPVYTQDILSAIYYLRTKDLKVGNKYSFPVHVDDKYYRMTISVKKTGTVATDDGWREALLLRPNIEDPSKRKEARQHLQENSSGVRIWVSNDQHKIPLKISLPAYFGSVYGYLHKYRPN